MGILSFISYHNKIIIIKRRGWRNGQMVRASFLHKRGGQIHRDLFLERTSGLQPPSSKVGMTNFPWTHRCWDLPAQASHGPSVGLWAPSPVKAPKDLFRAWFSGFPARNTACWAWYCRTHGQRPHALGAQEQPRESMRTHARQASHDGMPTKHLYLSSYFLHHLGQFPLSFNM